MVDCPRCHGAGWVTRRMKPGDSKEHQCFTADGGFQSVLVRCSVCMTEDKRQAELAAICGLTELERSFSMAQYRTNTQPRAEALAATNVLVDRGGWLTIHGPFGTGKTFLLCALVNRFVAQGRLAIYTSTSRLLDYLRWAYKPGSEIEGDAYWENLVRADLLAIDEAEKYSPTAWAEERFRMLIDERYRSGQMFNSATVIATNDIDALPGYLKSRVLDRKFSNVALVGADERRRVN